MPSGTRWSACSVKTSSSAGTSRPMRTGRPRRQPNRFRDPHAEGGSDILFGIVAVPPGGPCAGHPVALMLDGLSLTPLRSRNLAAPFAIVAVAILLLIGATLAAGASPPVFVVFGAGLVALVAIAAVWWPRTAIVLVALSPILDRYIVADVLPAQLETAAHYLSEAMLLVVSLILAGRALVRGELVAALRHPTTAALIIF